MTDYSQETVQQLNQMANEVVGLLQNDRAVDAMRIADALAQKAPDVPGVHYLRVVCLNRVGRHEEALVAAADELRVNPGHEGARQEYDNLTKAFEFKTQLEKDPQKRSYHSAIPHAALESIQAACHRYAYRGIPMLKNPFDFALYPLLIWDIKPATIIEIGTKSGGSAVWFGDTVTNYGFNTHIYSLDIVKVTNVSHPRVTFLEANGRELEKSLTPEFMNSLPRPLLVIEDADHSYETSSGVLRFMHPHMKSGEYIVIEDGIISDLDKDASASSGPHRAIKEFISQRGGDYEMDAHYLDFFGYNYTWCTNGILRKK